jgi:ParB-like chromosome segregation protein Spo0J
MNKVLKTADLPQEIMSLSDLKPNPHNPNSHPEDQIKILRHLIKTHGYYAVTITIQKSTGLIIKGHGVREALMLEGYDKARVNVKDCTDAEADAILIADNKIASDSVIDDSALQQLISQLSDQNVPSLDFGFDSKDLEELASRILADSLGFPDGEPMPQKELKSFYQIVIDCQNEEEQQHVYNELTEQGYKCKVLTL